MAENKTPETNVQEYSKRVVLIDKKGTFLLCIDGQVIKDVIAYQIVRKDPEAAVEISITVSVNATEIDLDFEL